MSDADGWDSFDVSALYYDLLAGDDGGSSIAAGLVRPDDVVLDIGAGTGRLAVHLGERASAVFALEPNAAMRAVALSRLAGSRERLDRVTVLPLAAEGDWRSVAPALPAAGDVDVALMLGVVHTMEPSSRRAAFRNVADWLADDGVLAISGVGESAAPVDLRLGVVEMGSLRVEGRLRTDERPDGWRTTVDYITSSDGLELWRETVSYRSHAPTVADVTRELADVGLPVAWAGRAHRNDLVVASRRKDWHLSGNDSYS